MLDRDESRERDGKHGRLPRQSSESSAFGGPLDERPAREPGAECDGEERPHGTGCSGDDRGPGDGVIDRAAGGQAVGEKQRECEPGGGSRQDRHSRLERCTQAEDGAALAGRDGESPLTCSSSHVERARDERRPDGDHESKAGEQRDERCQRVDARGSESDCRRQRRSSPSIPRRSRSPGRARLPC